MTLRAPLIALASSLLLLTACGDSSSSGSGGSGGSGTGGSDTGGGGSGTGASGTGGSGTGASGFGGAGGADCATPCEPGTVCSNGECVPGCSLPEAPCPGSLECCDGACLDTMNDPASCGMGCGGPCADAANVAETCSNGFCGIGDCDAGFSNCDGDPANGCETMGTCACTPGAMQGCYEGPPGTAGVGLCVAGTQTCLPSGTGWGACINQIFPVDEVCADGMDNDCDGATDEDDDLDGDGYGVCSGDCCDVPGMACGNPELVNPGAFEAAGNMVDDDCNPNTPDTGTPTNCSTTAMFAGTTGMDLIQAMDLCQTTTANGTSWGVISATVTNDTDGGGSAPNNLQLAVMTAYGTPNVPQLNGTMAVISSGTARDAGDPGFINPDGTGWGTGSNNVGWPPSYPGTGTVNDAVNLRAVIRVPTNAQSLSYKFKFFSAEYPEWVGSSFNDTYLALLTSAAPGIPANKNISFDSQGDPVDVNNGFFDGPQSDLTGTGMPAGDAGCTNWLTTTAPVVPGEVITIDFTIFDVADHAWDSLVLLDAFQFSVTPSMVGTKE